MSAVKIFDGFTFFNELDLLELRLHELAPVVSRFVLVEGTRTFAGKPKPLYFADNRARFKEFEGMIEHVVVDDWPIAPRSAWDNEHHQRNAILRGLDGCGPDDYVLVSDVDEIPRASAISGFSGDAATLVVAFFYYHLNCQNTRGPEARLACPVIYRRRLLGDPQVARSRRLEDAMLGKIAVLPDAGWHFSYMGGVEAIKTKIDAYSHQELNNSGFTESRSIEKRLDACTDPFDRPGFVWRPVDIDASFPLYLSQNLGRFAHMIRPVTDVDRAQRALDAEIATLTDSLAAARASADELRRLRSSFSYRLGQALTSPWRALRGLFP